MDALSFIAAIIGSTAWPATIVLLVVLFRRNLADLIPALRRLKYKDLELEFNRQVAEAKQELGLEATPEVVEGTPRKALPPVRPERPTRYFQALAEVSPRAAILEAWLGFELAANSAIDSLRLAPAGRPLQMPKLFSLLEQSELLTKAEVDALSRLRALRNQVVHGPEPELSAAAIAEYASVVTRITDDLQKRVNLRLPNPD